TVNWTLVHGGAGAFDQRIGARSILRKAGEPGAGLDPEGAHRPANALRQRFGGPAFFAAEEQLELPGRVGGQHVARRESAGGRMAERAYVRLALGVHVDHRERLVHEAALVALLLEAGLEVRVRVKASARSIAPGLLDKEHRAPELDDLPREKRHLSIGLE